MKTVLIVEDEKLIRQGIKTMIKRSGVPVELIMECSNGEMALEVIREQKIDVMFTDIRMPKMDGIELVQKMQSCGHVPLTVAISGYDDFSYAVEMLRNGVREYILKPIEREKITEVLKKLNNEIEHDREKVKVRQKLSHQQMKHLMLLSNTTDEEIQMLEKQYESEFYQGAYAVCCQNAKERERIRGDKYIYLKEIEGNDIFVVEEEMLTFLLTNELLAGCSGVSAFHHGLRELCTAYRESVSMRKAAFCRNLPHISWPGAELRAPEKLRQEADKLLAPEACQKRLQLLGTGHTEELEKVWRQFFFEVKNGRISAEAYETCMETFFTELLKTYRNVIGEDSGEFKQFSALFAGESIEDYEEKLLGWLLSLNETINSRFDANRSQLKMKQAVAYIEENYAKDLNMAVVSNYVSMNYSLFSYSFKQYTGSNFVNFLKNIRMREAKRLLAETDMRIVEISQEVGYDNEKHFMKLFKAACGVSPSEYRKNMNRDQ